MKNKMWVFGITAMSYLLMGCGAAGSGSEAAMQKADSLMSPSSIYHEEYSKIARTLVTVQDFEIRTEDGKNIHVPTQATAIDLQMLSGFSQGLKLDLTNVRFPGGATEIRVAEIKTRIVRPDTAQIVFGDLDKCWLRDLPKYLVLYTAQPIALTNAAYNVKMNFSPLASIQIDDSTQWCQDKSSSSGRVCQIANYRQLVPGIPLSVDDTF